MQTSAARKIAHLVKELCTPGNNVPGRRGQLGIESFRSFRFQLIALPRSFLRLRSYVENAQCQMRDFHNVLLSASPRPFEK